MKKLWTRFVGWLKFPAFTTPISNGELLVLIVLWEVIEHLFDLIPVAGGVT